MSTPLMATKLFIPPAGKNLVLRLRLLEKLDRGLSPGCHLIVVSAPAGYGKTTLLSTWLAHLKSSEYHPSPLIAWLTLEGSDNDPNTFWSYIISSLQAQQDGLGGKAQNLLQPPNPPDLEGILAALVNDLAQISTPFFLILDDFYLIRNPTIHQSLSFFIDHLPPQFHLLILSRTDPPLKLALLRGRGHLLEIRLAELRFSNDEATAFLNEGMGLTLSLNEIDLLNAKAEGWAAGLQMAGISLQGRSDTTRFIQSFSGSNRYILDYLVEEVLKRQPAAVQDFLVRTSILDIFCSSLCDTLIKNTDQDDIPYSQSILEYLEDSSLFIIPMDDDRIWYRFHRLFADLLKNRLQQRLPNEISGLHRKASQWYEQNGWVTQAIEQALRAKDYEHAIFLINQSSERLFGYGDRAAVARWIDAIPEDQLRSNLELEVLRAASLTMDGHIREAETCLQNVEKWLAPVENPDDQQTILTGRIMTVYSNIASYRGDLDGVLHYAPQALEKLAGDPDLTWRSWNLVNLSNVSLGKGNVEASIQYLADAIACGKATHSPDMTLTTMFYHILILWIQGRIREASQSSQEGLAYMTENQLDHLPRAGALFMMWGLILCERHELAKAEELINQGYRLVEPEKSPLWLELANLIRLRFWIAKGDLPRAVQIARDAIQLLSEYEIPGMLATWIRGFITWIWVLEGRFLDAEKNFQEHEILVNREVSHPYHNEYLSLALLLEAKGDLISSVNLLERIIYQSEADKQFRWAIVGYLLLAQIYQSQEDIPHAMTVLEKALAMTEAEDNVQVFMDAGEPIKRLLEVALQRRMHVEYTRRLLSDFQEPPHRVPVEKDVRQNNLALAEPLTRREMEVLRLIIEGYTNKEIAQSLGISLRTVKFFGTNIYSKLGVTGRTRAIHRARELGLL
jgi:LuxR family maltose regulon positive regulatory protein